MHIYIYAHTRRKCAGVRVGKYTRFIFPLIAVRIVSIPKKNFHFFQPSLSLRSELPLSRRATDAAGTVILYYYVYILLYIERCAEWHILLYTINQAAAAK